MNLITSFLEVEPFTEEELSNLQKSGSLFFYFKADDSYAILIVSRNKGLHYVIIDQFSVQQDLLEQKSSLNKRKIRSLKTIFELFFDIKNKIMIKSSIEDSIEIFGFQLREIFKQNLTTENTVQFLLGFFDKENGPQVLEQDPDIFSKEKRKSILKKQESRFKNQLESFEVKFNNAVISNSEATVITRNYEEALKDAIASIRGSEETLEKAIVSMRNSEEALKEATVITRSYGEALKEAITSNSEAVSVITPDSGGETLTSGGEAPVITRGYGGSSRTTLDGVVITPTGLPNLDKVLECALAKMRSDFKANNISLTDLQARNRWCERYFQEGVNYDFRVGQFKLVYSSLRKNPLFKRIFRS